MLFFKFFKYCFERIRLISFFWAQASLSSDFWNCRFLLSDSSLILISLAYNFWASESLACLLFSYSIFYFYFSSSYFSSYNSILEVSTTLLRRALNKRHFYLKDGLDLIIKVKEFGVILFDLSHSIDASFLLHGVKLSFDGSVQEEIGLALSFILNGFISQGLYKGFGLD